jgi:hypothetical protein
MAVVWTAHDHTSRRTLRDGVDRDRRVPTRARARRFRRRGPAHSSAISTLRAREASELNEQLQQAGREMQETQLKLQVGPRRELYLLISMAILSIAGRLFTQRPPSLQRPLVVVP